MAESIHLKLNHAGMQELLNSSEVREVLHPMADRVLTKARSTAPRVTGAYAESLHVEDATTDRAVVRVASDLEYAMVVEAEHHTLARALDAL